MPASHDDTPSGSCPLQAKNPLNHSIYSDLRRIAASQLRRHPDGSTLQATELVHEAWLRLWKENPAWRSRGHLLASTTLTMRRILIDRARKRVSKEQAFQRSDTPVEDLPSPEAANKLLHINEAITQLEGSHPLQACIVLARVYGDLSNAEIALELGISERSVERHWALAKVWLMRKMESPA